jgi:hypothetical protein
MIKEIEEVKELGFEVKGEGLASLQRAREELMLKIKALVGGLRTAAQSLQTRHRSGQRRQLPRLFHALADFHHRTWPHR